MSPNTRISYYTASSDLSDSLGQSWSDLEHHHIGVHEEHELKGRRQSSYPIQIQSHKSANALISRSPTETFLSAESPYQLPFVPLCKKSTPNTSETPADCLTWSNHWTKPRSSRSSMLSAVLSEQSEYERSTCKRQMKRKERLVQNSHVPLDLRPKVQIYPAKRPDQSKPYNYVNVSTW